MAGIIYKEESYQIMGACFEVYKEKGCGFIEPVYQECLSLELTSQNIPFIEQRDIKMDYKGCPLTQTFRPDFICFGEIIIEIKSVSSLNDKHRAQIHNYLKATKFHLGLLVNFSHHPQLEWERIIQ